MDEKKPKSLAIPIWIFVAFVLLSLAGGIYLSIPSEEQIKGCLVTKHFKVELCPKSKSYVRLSQISPLIRRAIILSEDSSFYQHEGFDIEEIKKSFKENLEEKKFARGGSTISQQLSKNLFLTPEKSILRKIREALITHRIEKVLSKNEILEKYLNVIQYGKGIFGIKAATQFYFKKHPSEVNAVEAAFIAMLLPSPIKYSSSFHKKRLSPFAKKRVQQILRLLQVTGSLDEYQYVSAVDSIDWIFTGPPEPIHSVESDNVTSEEVFSDESLNE